MKPIRTKISRVMFSALVVSALGFGGSQAFAAPSAAPVRSNARDCSACAQQCAVIKLCQPGYCQCATDPQ